MTEYSYAAPAKTDGVVYRSSTEAKWARLFTGLGIRFDYEPATFVFTDGVIYTPDFFLKGVKRYIEVKNDNADTDSCQKLNDLARHLGSYTMLLNGSPKVASAYIFDGRPPREGWEAGVNPLYYFAYEEIYGHNASYVINRLMQPNPLAALQDQLTNRLAVGRLVKNLPMEISYDISKFELDALKNKIANRKSAYIILPPETPEMYERYNSAPTRRNTASETLAELREPAINDTRLGNAF